MNKIRGVALAASAAVLMALPGVPAAAAAVTRALPTTLTAIRASHHPGYDRLVFQFRGRLPAERSVRYVSSVVADPSGKVVPVAGSARLLVRFFAANPAAGLRERTFALPGLIQVVNAGQFEAVLRYGVGVARKEPFKVFALTRPSRIVIDIRTPYRTVPVHIYLAVPGNFAPVRQSGGLAACGFTCPVDRQVIPPRLATGALQRLFAGPTRSEAAAGMRFFATGATGFKNLRISDHVARVQLTGACSNPHSSFNIAGEIIPTLKQFRSVRWVKIYDPSGHTPHPDGHSDSVPACLFG